MRVSNITKSNWETRHRWKRKRRTTTSGGEGRKSLCDAIIITLSAFNIASHLEQRCWNMRPMAFAASIAHSMRYWNALPVSMSTTICPGSMYTVAMSSPGPKNAIPFCQRVMPARRVPPPQQTRPINPSRYFFVFLQSMHTARTARAT